MKTLKIIFSIAFVFMLIMSCKDKDRGHSQPKSSDIFDPKVKLSDLENNYMAWWIYQSKFILLSSEFDGFGSDSIKISKKQFLETLTSGQFIPLRLPPINGIEQYKLFKLDTKTDKSIVNTIKNTGLTYLFQYKMEGESFPQFDVTDLKGNHYTNESIKGKKTLFKTWFIKCVACVAEFPELNDFVEKHEKDMLFVSLALDSEAELKNFLETKTFKYETVANQTDFIRKNLKTNTYPTHIVVDENGVILKVVNKATELFSFLEDIQKSHGSVPPPPPM